MGLSCRDMPRKGGPWSYGKYVMKDRTHMTFKKTAAFMEVPYNEQFVKDVLDGMYDWVRVLDREHTIIYANKAMVNGLNFNPVGLKCYSALGLLEPCHNCISRDAIFDGLSHQKEETIGGLTFSVMSSPVKNEQGEIVAVVEVLRDVTQTQLLQQRIGEQNRKLQYDLSIAKKLQCSLLPKALPVDKVGFSFVYRPCEALSGDFLDIFSIDDQHVGVYIADVSGHGVPASMLTVFLRSTLNRTTLSPAEALQDLYTSFNESYREQELYITIFYGIIDLHEMNILYANAGLNASPIVFGPNKFEILRSPGIPISDWTDTPDYRDQKLPLQKKDRIFFFTDGIIELKNQYDEQFGEKRMLDILLGNRTDLNEVLDQILTSACTFSGGEDFAEIQDDITVALLEMK
jgi:sigma-B regulation protein RsbU (phosphoserine phosphatase)